MKKLFLITFATLTLGTQAHAVIVKAGQSNNPPPPNQSVETCSYNIYIAKGIGIAPGTGDEVCQDRRDLNFQSCVQVVSTRLDQTNFNDETVKRVAEACQYSIGDSRGQVDPLFAGCVYELSGYFGNNYFDATGNYCSRVKVAGFAGCVGKLSRAGLRNPEQLVSLCNTSGGQDVTSCVEQHGSRSLSECMDKFDPATIARKQAEERRRQEQRRLEEERIRREAAAKQAAQKAAEEAKRKAAEEAQRKADETKKNNGGVGTTPVPTKPAPQPGGVGTTPVPQPAPQPSNPAPAPAPTKPTTPPPAPQPAPQDPAESGGGVIVDLPNF